MLKRHTHRKQKAGFSLVELAIVLVIIGLIISSVLVGQDIIRAAELRAIGTQMTGYKTAVQTFATRYDNSLPGDMRNSTNFGLTDADADGGDGEGDGDGLIESAGGGIATFDGEIANFWLHLGETNLIQGTYDGYDDAGATANDIIGLNMPEIRSRGQGWGAYNDGVDNYLIAGVLGGEDDDDFHTASTFRPQDAFDIDNKLDDGIPLGGIVLARDPFNTDNSGNPHFIVDATTTASTCYLHNSTVVITDDAYNTAVDTPQCALSFVLPRI